MDVKDKLTQAIRTSLTDPYVRLEDDDGISGYVVSRSFRDMSTLDRQKLIDDAIGHASPPLSPQEHRRILMIAGLTPEEADALGTGVRVHRLRDISDGSIEILLHGGISDAEYVREALAGLAGLETTEPEHSAGARGVFMHFQARAVPADPLLKERLIKALQDDPFIELMSQADRPRPPAAQEIER